MLKEYNYHTKAMGCNFDMTFIAETETEADKYFIQAKTIVTAQEKRFSRFDKNSELSFLNKNKSLKFSPEFRDVYKIARDLYDQTKGQFNSLLQVARIGYDKTFEKIIDKENINSEEIEYNINMEDILISDQGIALGKKQQLDFGGFLKGYVTEKIAKSINSAYGMIINIGGDVYVRGKDQNKEKFVLEIINPRDGSKNISLEIFNESLCTSGTYKRLWEIKSLKNKKHHILDYKTRDSTQTDIISASVIHKNGAWADALATLAITLGSREAKKFFDTQKIEFVAICTNGDIITSKIFKNKSKR